MLLTCLYVDEGVLREMSERAASELGLRDATLLRSEAFIDGLWLKADAGGSFGVDNPATGALLGSVPNMGAAETERAILAANRALPAWRKRTAHERAAILRRWHDLILESQEDLARIITGEQGKPRSESRAEVRYAASFIEWFAEEAKRVYGDVIPTDIDGRVILAIKEPIGVTAAITPWNFPCAMITRKAAPALASGCTLVLKPAEATPYSALALAVLAERAGIPPGVFSVVTGAPAEIGKELTGNPLVRKLSFTGSTAVGKKLMAQSAGTMKKLSLELGGNAPFIVFDDADVEDAVRGTINSKFRNCGQTCVCTNRILVQDGIYERFLSELSIAVGQLRVGAGIENEQVDLGPLINIAAVEKVEAHIADAVAKGAKVVRGGHRHSAAGSFFEPTIISGATSEMLIAQEETFGPVAALFRFKTEAEAIEMANNTRYGLASYFYSQNLNRTWRVLAALEFGMVGVNESLISTTVAPFGGIKESGMGREGSKYGIDEFLEIKYACIGGLKSE